MEEVKQHSSKEDAWTVMHGKVRHCLKFRSSVWESDWLTFD